MSILSQIRNHGWKYSFAILFNRVVPLWLFRTRRFVVYRMAIETGANEQSSVAIRECQDEAAIRAVEELTYFQREHSTGRSQAFSATVDGTLAGGLWAATEKFDEHELGIQFAFEADQAWLFAAGVSKEYRRHGVYSQLLSSAIQQIAAAGQDDLLVAVNPDNIGSRKIHQKRSRSTVGHVLVIRLLKITGCWTWGDILKERTVSLDSKNRPVVVRFPREK